MRYLNGMMDGENPDRRGDNVIEMRWLLQRELGGSVVFFHEVTIPPGTVEGTHQHIGSEELYYVVSGRGRVYLPEEDLTRFGCGVADGAAFRAMMRFQAERAYSYYEEARSLVPMLDAPGRAVFLVMLRTYRGLLDEIVARDYDVFRERVRLPAWRKLWLVAKALPVRYGLALG